MTTSKDNPGRNFLERIISDALEQMPRAEITADEEDRLLRRGMERASLPRRVKKLEKKRERREKVGRKKLKLSKSQIAILAAARLTPLQERYWRLRIEHGLGPTAIARKVGVHHSVVQESLRAANAKIENAKLKPR